MLLELCKTADGDVSEIERIKDKYKDLGENGFLINSKNEICVNILTLGLKFLLRHLIIELLVATRKFFVKK